MKKSDQLKQERSLKQDAQNVIVQKARAEKREWTPEEEQQFDALDAEIETLNRSIERELKAEKVELAVAERTGRRVGDKGDDEDPENREHKKLVKRFSVHRALRMMGDGQQLDGVEKEVHEETVKRALASGIVVRGLGVPTGVQQRFAGQSVTQDGGEYGAALVDTDVQEMVDYLRPQPVLEKLGAKFLTGLQGDLKFPVNEGGIVATWEGEVDPGTESKNKYSSKTMKPKRLVSIVPVSIQNLIQSSIDLERYTMNEINSVIANALDLAGINGSGTNDQPLGILNTAGVPVIVGGTNGAALTWPNIVAMETSVFIENANAAKMGYAINPVTKGKLKTTKHDAGDLNYLMSAADTINGYPVGVSNLIPGNLTKGTGANLSAAIFGDFSQLIMGQWGFVDLVLDKSTAGSGYYRIIVNGFYDVLVRQPKSFAIIKDIANV